MRLIEFSKDNPYTACSSIDVNLGIPLNRVTQAVFEMNKLTEGSTDLPFVVARDRNDRDDPRAASVLVVQFHDSKKYMDEIEELSRRALFPRGEEREGRG